MVMTIAWRDTYFRETFQPLGLVLMPVFCFAIEYAVGVDFGKMHLNMQRCREG